MLKLVGGLEHFFLFAISYMGCHPNPIDELHHFSRWLKHVKTHQPVKYSKVNSSFLPGQSPVSICFNG